MSNATYKRIESVRKAAEILDFLGDQAGPVPAAEIARALDLPTGTAMSQLWTLADAGFVEFGGSGVQLGKAIAALWARRGQIVKRRMARLRAEAAELGIEL